MEQKIIGFHLDSEGHWVADLVCGHRQHVRHDPPLVQREWVLDKVQRESRIGSLLNCKRCSEVGVVVADAVQKVFLQVIRDAYLDAGNAGMCKEGQLDLIIDRLKNLDLSTISERAIAEATTDLGTLSKGTID